MREWLMIAAIVVVMGVVIALCVHGTVLQQRALDVVFAEGVFEAVDYVPGSGGWNTVAPRTIIRWRGGRSSVLRGMVSVEMVRGQRYTLTRRGKAVKKPD